MPCRGPSHRAEQRERPYRDPGTGGAWGHLELTRSLCAAGVRPAFDVFPDHGGEDGHCLAEHVEEFVQAGGWVGEVFRLLAHGMQYLGAVLGVEDLQEVVGVYGLDAQRPAGVGWEVSDVAGDDHPGVRDDRSGQYMPVLGMVGHARFELGDRFGGHGGIVERFPHETGDAMCGVRWHDAVGDEVAGHFGEDGLAPVGVVQFAFGETEERVTQAERVQDAGVEDRSKGHTGHPNDPARRLPVAARGLLRGLREFTQCFAAPLASLVAVSLDIFQQDTTMSGGVVAGAVVGHVAAVQQLDQVRP